MPRNDGRIEPGQRLNGAISARAWNRALDAADLVLGDRLGTEAGMATPGAKPYAWVYCKPSVTVPRWGILAITGLDVTPTATESDTATRTFQDSPVVTGGTPTASTTAWGVAVEPIASGSLGRLAVAGVVQCRLDVQNSTDSYATCQSSTAELRTGSAGEGQILWKQSGTGAGKWGLVRMGHVRGIVRGTFSAPWSKGDSATVTDGTNTYTAVNHFASLTGTGTKNCAIAFTAGQWILIAAEC